ncbi:CBS domain-containing protein [Psychromonas sp. MME2]|uniref:CBS domain-containing protein n=1 Tax=unclassified Psychromonas TaxID=2614957 RepID=UPI00339CE9A1
MKNLEVSNFMTEKSIYFTKEMTVERAVKKLLNSKYIGGPVLDDSGRVIGWLSEQDCLKKMIASSYYCQQVALVADAMVPEGLTVKANMSVFELGQLMLQQKPKIYPVVDNDNKLLGMITRKNVLAAMSEQLESC